jgi:ubiquinone/menaquinone biosynthesis C-methylase UbiE/uncharacterized protein YbaR (Trm112 family)
LFKNILDKIVCPECGGKLKLDIKQEINGEVIKGILSCSNNHKWEVEDGVINFKSKEQEFANNWSEMYKEVNYDELDKKIKEGTPQSQLNGMECLKIEFINSIKSLKAEKVLDIATGRGMLMTRLVEALGDSIELTCVDLSFEVLKYDRIKSVRIDPNARVNYIACDATKLPFVNNAFDLSVSFFGIINMGDLTQKGVSEGERVSKNGLLNAGIVIKDDNPKIDELNKLLKDNGYDFNINSCTESSFYGAHKIDERYKVEISNIFEGIAEKNEFDIVPVEGEWFAYTICSTKCDK